MKIKKKWNLEEKASKLLNLKTLENEINKLAEIEIIKPQEDKNLLKKLFYAQHLIKILRNRIVMRIIRTDLKFNEKISEIVMVLQLEMGDENK